LGPHGLFVAGAADVSLPHNAARDGDNRVEPYGMAGTSLDTHSHNFRADSMAVYDVEVSRLSSIKWVLNGLVIRRVAGRVVLWRSWLVDDSCRNIAITLIDLGSCEHTRKLAQSPGLVSQSQTHEETDCFFRRFCFASVIPARPEPTRRSEVGSGTTEALPVRFALTPRMMPISDITKSPVP
jgi:hypothetical protein